MRASTAALCRAAALESAQDNLSSPLALVQVLIAVFSSRAPDEMGALVQVAGKDGGGAISALALMGLNLQNDTPPPPLQLSVFVAVYRHKPTGFQKGHEVSKRQTLRHISGGGESNP